MEVREQVGTIDRKVREPSKVPQKGDLGIRGGPWIDLDDVDPILADLESVVPIAQVLPSVASIHKKTMHAPHRPLRFERTGVLVWIRVDLDASGKDLDAPVRLVAKRL